MLRCHRMFGYYPVACYCYCLESIVRHRVQATHFFIVSVFSRLLTFLESCSRLRDDQFVAHEMERLIRRYFSVHGQNIDCKVCLGIRIKFISRLFFMGTKVAEDKFCGYWPPDFIYRNDKNYSKSKSQPRFRRLECYLLF
jgi:hypothetical protein